MKPMADRFNCVASTETSYLKTNLIENKFDASLIHRKDMSCKQSPVGRFLEILQLT